MVARHKSWLKLLAGALGLFLVTLGESSQKLARNVALLVAAATIGAAALALGQHADLFSGAYRALEVIRGWNTTACLVYDPAQHAEKAKHEARRKH